MIKKFIEEQLDINKPTEYIYKLTVCRNKLNDMIAEFNKNWQWCSGCQTYINIETADDGAFVELMHDFSPARHALRCKKCRSILKLLN